MHSFCCCNTQRLRKVDTSYAPSFSLFSSSIDNQQQPYDRTATAKNSRYRKRIRNRQSSSSWPSYYQPTTKQATSSSNNKQERNGNHEEYQIQKWLLSSTTLLLGDELTFQLINGETNATSIDTSIHGIGSNRYQLLDNFDTKKEYMKHSTLTMLSWCQWIIQCSSNGRSRRRRNRRRSNKYQLTYGSIKCSLVNAAKIVDSILLSILDVIDLEEGEVYDTEVDKKDGLLGDTTLLELIHIAIVAWSNSKNRNGLAVNRTEYWLQLLQEIFWNVAFL